VLLVRVDLEIEERVTDRLALAYRLRLRLVRAPIRIDNQVEDGVFSDEQRQTHVWRNERQDLGLHP
jgi:hypothetical protein